MGVVLRREDFADTGDYLEALDEAERQDLEFYQKINPKLGRPRACAPEAEPPAATDDDDEDEDEDEDKHDEYSDSDPEQVGRKRKRRGRTLGPGHIRPLPITGKIVRRKYVPPARNMDSVLVPVRWSLRSRTRAPSAPRAPAMREKALYDTPSEEEEEDAEGVRCSMPKRKRNLPSSGSRLSTTAAANIGANSDIEDAESNDGEECAFPLATPPSLLHLIHRSPSPSFAPSVGGSAFSSLSSLSPPPPSSRSISSRASTPSPDAPHCGNCPSTISSGGWRRSILEPETRLCNACSKYERKHHRHRPSALNQRRKIQRFSPSASPQCSNCQSTSASQWNRSMLEPEKRVCGACSRYERTYQRHRPTTLAQRPKRRRFPPSASPQCSNCQSTSSAGQWYRSVLKSENRLCSPCSRYERMYQRHRPLALAQAASERGKLMRKRKTKLRSARTPEAEPPTDDEYEYEEDEDSGDGDDDEYTEPGGKPKRRGHASGPLLPERARQPCAVNRCSSSEEEVAKSVPRKRKRNHRRNGPRLSMGEDEDAGSIDDGQCEEPKEEGVSLPFPPSLLRLIRGSFRPSVPPPEVPHCIRSSPRGDCARLAGKVHKGAIPVFPFPTVLKLPEDLHFEPLEPQCARTGEEAVQRLLELRAPDPPPPPAGA
ncbi:hypothetical protein C8R43DRAFT_1131633 [Mycena crocata]|nr:hypothetical protein C8R43DRAFT_1131633 [Mycena crocata]